MGDIGCPRNCRRAGRCYGAARPTHLQQQIERLTEAYLAGVLGLEEFRRRRRDLDQAKEALETQVRQREAQVDRQTEIARLSLSIDEFCRRVRAGF